MVEADEWLWCRGGVGGSFATVLRKTRYGFNSVTGVAGEMADRPRRCKL